MEDVHPWPSSDKNAFYRHYAALKHFRRQLWKHGIHKEATDGIRSLRESIDRHDFETSDAFDELEAHATRLAVIAGIKVFDSQTGELLCPH